MIDSTVRTLGQLLNPLTFQRDFGKQPDSDSSGFRWSPVAGKSAYSHARADPEKVPRHLGFLALSKEAKISVSG